MAQPIKVRSTGNRTHIVVENSETNPNNTYWENLQKQKNETFLDIFKKSGEEGDETQTFKITLSDLYLLLTSGHYDFESSSGKMKQFIKSFPVKTSAPTDNGPKDIQELLTHQRGENTITLSAYQYSILWKEYCLNQHIWNAKPELFEPNRCIII